jgi:1-acyl-sn-glycerol-3-phosphate acyltransferase
MIKAHHRSWAHWIFRPYLRNVLKRTFQSIQLYGECPEVPQNRSILLLPNHSSWWDGFIIYFLNNRYWKKTPFVMMEEKQLNRFSFFNRLGAFSVRPGDPEDVQKTLAYSAGLLENPGHLVFLFPQGSLLPWNRRPLRFRTGYEHILSMTSAEPKVYLCGIRLEYTGEKRAQIFLSFRELSHNERQPDAAAREMEMVLQDMEASIAREKKGTRLFCGKKSPGG